MSRRVRNMVITALTLFVIGAASIVGVLFKAGVEVEMNNPTVPSFVADIHPNVPSTTQPIVPTMNLEGVWTYKSDKGGVFEATITDKSIKILMKTPDDTSMLYWKGTFQSQQSPGAMVSSDVSEDAFVLSKSKHKDFVVGIDTITFEFTASGITKKVELRRV